MNLSFPLYNIYFDIDKVKQRLEEIEKYKLFMTEQDHQYDSNREKEGINITLNERGSRYGPFTTHASITQGLKQVMHKTEGWGNLDPEMKESLEMIVHKIGRILNGDPFYKDSWVDIEGYAHLISEQLND